MHRYILKRLLIMIPVVLAITLLVFSILNFSPGDTARVMLGVTATQDAIDQFNHELGLDKPFTERYVGYVAGLLHGDFGKSYRTKAPVLTTILERFPNTLKLAAFGILISILIGIPVGIISAIKQYTVIDNTSLVGALLISSMPSFWLGMLLILLFSVKLGWFPATGVNSLRNFVLPSITASSLTMAVIIRMTRSTMLEVIRQDYIRTARAKGAKERSVIFRHALGNSLLPIITVIGVNFGALLGGTVVIEQVFAVPGVGSMILDGINNKDMPVVLGGVVYLAVVFSLINLLVDIIYAYIDPRIRSRYQSAKAAR